MLIAPKVVEVPTNSTVYVETDIFEGIQVEHIENRARNVVTMKANPNANIILFVSGLVVGAISCLYFSRLVQPSQRYQPPNAFYLGVKVIFPNGADMSEFESEFERLAEYVRRSEPSTVSYELLRSDKNDLQIYILERYRTKDDYLEIHKKSKPFLAFREKFQRMIERGAVVDGDSYLESGIGFI